MRNHRMQYDKSYINQFIISKSCHIRFRDITPQRIILQTKAEHIEALIIRSLRERETERARHFILMKPIPKLEACVLLEENDAASVTAPPNLNQRLLICSQPM